METTRQCDICEGYITYDEDGEPVEGQSCGMLGCPHLPDLTDRVDAEGEPLPLDFDDIGC